MEVCNLKLKKEERKYNKFLRDLGTIIAIAALTFTILSLRELPNNVPTYFGLDGIFSGYVSNKFFIFIYSIFSISALVGFNLLAYFPEKLNSRVKITPENYKRQYKLKSTFMSIGGLEAVIIFSLMQCMVTRAVLNGDSGVNVLFTAVSFAIVVVTECIYYYKANKIK